MQASSSNATLDKSDSNASEFISLGDLFHIIRQRWILASSTALVVAGLFAIVLLNQTPQYEAEASLVVELSADKVVNVQEVVENSVQNSSLLETAMNTHIERLKSRTMAGRVVESLSEEQQVKLTEAFTGPLEEIPLEERPAGTFATPLYPFVPGLFVAVAVLIVGSVLWTSPLRSGAGFALLAAGVPAYLYWSRASRNDSDEGG